MDGFFNPVNLAPKRKTIPLIARCSACQLYRHCQSPKMPVDGRGKRQILICGESPAKEEDNQNKPFVGKAGYRITSALARLNVDIRDDCFITNALICRSTQISEKGNVVNRTPTDREIEHCRPNVIKVIKDYEPQVIILLGGSALKSVLGWLWKEEVGSVDRWRGWSIPNQKLNTWICPTWHPSYLDRSERVDGRINPVMEMMWLNDLKNAVSKTDRPWTQIPDFVKQIKVIYSAEDVRVLLEKVMIRDKPVAFDLETEGLKPDNSDLQIYTCAVSNGEETFSFPWHGQNVVAMKEFFLSSIPKFNQNLKYEHRWILAKMGIHVNHWVDDSMVGMHVLDNRPGITGLKFQAFCLLGQDSYDDDVKPYLKSEGNNSKNRIGEFPLAKVLFYGGCDALLTWHITQIHRKMLGLSYEKTVATKLYKRGDL